MKPRVQWRSLPRRQYRFTDTFWKRQLDTNRKVTLPAEYEQCKKTGRLESLRLQWKQGDPNPPHVFWDSDLAKWLEAAAYGLATHPDPGLEALCDEAIGWIEKARQPDGYYNVHFTVVEPEKRWTNLRDYDYCQAHAPIRKQKTAEGHSVRALYNGVISGVSRDGRRFFYENSLAACPPCHKFTHSSPPAARVSSTSR